MLILAKTHGRNEGEGNESQLSLTVPVNKEGIYEKSQEVPIIVVDYIYAF